MKIKNNLTAIFDILTLSLMNLIIYLNIYYCMVGLVDKGISDALWQHEALLIGARVLEVLLMLILPMAVYTLMLIKLCKNMSGVSSILTAIGVIVLPQAVVAVIMGTTSIFGNWPASFILGTYKFTAIFAFMSLSIFFVAKYNLRVVASENSDKKSSPLVYTAVNLGVLLMLDVVTQLICGIIASQDAYFRVTANLFAYLRFSVVCVILYHYLLTYVKAYRKKTEVMIVGILLFILLCVGSTFIISMLFEWKWIEYMFPIIISA